MPKRGEVWRVNLGTIRHYGYLTLTAQEMKQYEREFGKLAPEEQETRMELVSSWEHQGQERIIARLIKRRFGSITPEITARLDALSADALDELAEAIFDFSNIADLESWLIRHMPN